MSKLTAPTPIRAEDYEAIESALLDSARGRWFLTEYARRNRTADTQMLLDAITKLEAFMMSPAGSDSDERIRTGLIEMSEAIAQTRQEIRAMASSNQNSQLSTATEELDAIVESTEKATSEILEATEAVQETAWLLREKGADEQMCDQLDQRATDIYTACSFQDITGQRTSKVFQILHYLEKRVNSMIDIWGLENVEVRDTPEPESPGDARLLNGPQPEGQGLRQSEIDDMINFEDIRLDDNEIEAIEREPAAQAQETADTAVAPSPKSNPVEIQLPAPASEQAARWPAEPAAATPGEPLRQTPEASGTDEQSSDDGPTEVVRAEDFSKPADLTIDTLDQAKMDALFN
jgi:chemotaxis regulatin CheY-phosphate phosphatase CheZ